MSTNTPFIGINHRVGFIASVRVEQPMRPRQSIAYDRFDCSWSLVRLAPLHRIERQRDRAHGACAIA